MYLPLFIKTDNLPCLIIGGGKVAAHKVEILLTAGCALTLIAPEIEDAIRTTVNSGLIRWLERAYRHGDCTGYHLVIAATRCEETNRAVSDEARQKRIPINVVDVPELCTVIFGASWNDGPVTISVSTAGVAPFMAAVIRDRAAESAQGMGKWVEAAGRFRAAVRAVTVDVSEKERLYRRFVACIRRQSPLATPLSRELADWLAYLDSCDSPK